MPMPRTIHPPGHAPKRTLKICPNPGGPIFAGAGEIETAGLPRTRPARPTSDRPSGLFPWPWARNSLLCMGRLRGPGFDPHTWYTDDELKECPHCGERAAVPRGGGPSVCLSCEVVWIDEAQEKGGANHRALGPA
jgi:hypothetical protein